MVGQPCKTHVEILFIQNVEPVHQKSRVGLGCGLGMDLACTLQQTKNLTWTQSMPTLALGKLRHNCYGFQTSLDHTVRAHLKKAKFKSN